MRRSRISGWSSGHGPRAAFRLDRPLSGRDTATLVRGVDRHGHWIEEPAVPAREYDLACADAHRTSMDIRFAAYHGSVMPEP